MMRGMLFQFKKKETCQYDEGNDIPIKKKKLVNMMRGMIFQLKKKETCQYDYEWNDNANKKIRTNEKYKLHILNSNPFRCIFPSFITSICG
jgi:hypothetical protein